MQGTKAFVRRGVPVMILSLVAFSILWRGGKGLEATWLLAGVSMLAIFASVWLGEFVSDKHRDVPTGLWLALVLFVCWTGLSLLLSTTRNYGLDEFLRDGACALLFLWTARHASSDSGSLFLCRFVKVVTASVIAACMFGLLVYTLQPVSRFVGTFLDMRFHTDYWPNAWAEMLLLAWPMVVFATKKQWAIVRALVLGLVFGCVYLSYSRGGFLAFFGQLALFAVLEVLTLLRTRRGTHGALMPALTMLCALLAGFAVFSAANSMRSVHFTLESVARKATFTASEGTSSIDERRSFWNAAAALTKEKPIFGWGPYSFRFVQPRLQTEVFATSDHPHNVFLKLAMERGIPAVLLFALILAWILGHAGWSVFAGRNGEHHEFSVAALVSAAGVLAHNLIDYNLQFVGIALPLWMLFGILAPTVMLSRQARNLVRVTALILAVTIGCIAVLEGKYLVLSSLGRHAEALGDSEEALYWYEQSEGQFFSRDMHLGQASLELNAGNIATARETLEDYADVNAEDARLWVLLGKTELAAKNRGAAEAAFRKALDLGKYNYLLATEGLLEAIGTQPSRAVLKDIKPMAEEIYKKFAQAISQNVHFIALSDNVEVFERVRNRLKRLYPASAREYDALSKEALENAEKERKALEAKAPGMLW